MTDTVVKKLDIRTISRSELDAAYFLMSDERKAKCDGYKLYNDKRLCIASDMLLRRMLSEVTGINETEFEFSVDEKGKPYLMNYSCNFNISHSGEYAAVCVNKTNKTGIDIEKIRPVKYSLIERVCSEAEKQFVISDYYINSDVTENEAVCERFFRVWTYKEAFLKLTGEGISRELNTVIYSPEECMCEISDGYCMTVITEK